MVQLKRRQLFFLTTYERILKALRNQKSKQIYSGTSLLGILLAGYLAQQYLPPPTPKLVGIDLGTTYSCIGVYEAVTGRITIIPTKDGHLTIPSIVHFGENEISTGYEALNRAKTDPRNTIYDAKRLIGKQFTLEEIERMSGHYPFRIDLDGGSMAKMVIGTRENQTTVTPEFVGSRIIDVLRTAAETNLGVSVTKAVMAVPAEFDEMQRNFTKSAAKLAGLDVLRIINEPTAAALAYGLHKKENVNNVMVVDLGGGTSDVSILNVQHGMFLTSAIAGNNYLGGQDFNRRLFDHLLRFVENETGSKLTDAEEIHALQQTIEEAKLNLTNVDVVRLNIPFRSLNYVLDYDLTRDTFEKVNSDLFAKVVQLLDTVLNESELKAEDIDEIVLVGGSTRIPKVRQIIAEYFGKPPNTNLDPELAVGHGVALQAGIIGGMWPLQVSAIEIPTKLRKIHLK